ncbi:MAG: tetratricopeptide repeat protein, partial [Anaerolineae bacterium]|nr:tetratricopeptide repeat protein [Anaerolineae bacterium]
MNSDWDSGSLNRGAGGPGKQLAEGRLRSLLRRAEEAARCGQRAEARRLFRQALLLDPECEDALLWLGYLAGSPKQSLEYLLQARASHPNSPRVREAIAWAEERLREVAGGVPGPVGEPSEPPMKGLGQGMEEGASAPLGTPVPMGWAGRGREQRRPPLRPQVGAAGLALVGVAILAVLIAALVRWYTAAGMRPLPEPSATVSSLPSDMATLRELASAAVAGQDWERLIPLLERMRELTPEDEGVRQQFAVAHLRLGLQLANEGRLDEAIAHYDAAIRFYANDTDLQMARRIAIGYRDGREAIEAGRWAEAVDHLQPVYAVAPDFRDVSELLFSAYLHEALAFDGAQKLEAARLAYAHAAAIRPDDAQVQARLAEITRILTPPTPTPTPRPRKRIEISIAQQRLRAYE